MEEIISWEIGSTDLFLFWGGGVEEKISNCCLFWKYVSQTFPSVGPGTGPGSR
jgi:hypothetical protein